MMRLGLVHMELSAAPLAPLHYQPRGGNSRLFNLLAETGVSVAVLRLTGLTMGEKLAAIAEAGERRIPAVLDRAERLGYPDLLDRIKLYAHHAGSAGVHFILENDYYTSCDNAEAQQLLRRSVNHPALGFGFAPLHALADGRDPGQEVRALGRGLQLAYLWDAPTRMVVGRVHEDFDPGPAEDQTPGTDQGQVDWHDYFTALSSIGFRGILNLKWLGEDGWGTEQTESAIAAAAQFCTERARMAGYGS